MERLSFINGDGEEVYAPVGCDGLCRIECESWDPGSEFCQEQVVVKEESGEA